nr:hypothetical protein [uncultured Pedobacter sp.]
MKTVYLRPCWSLSQDFKKFRVHPLWLILLILFLVYRSLPLWIYRLDPTAALPDAGVGALVLLSILVFFLLLILSAYLFKITIKWLSLPAFSWMVSQFNTLTLWQQYVLYWASFALLLLAGIGCLSALC